MATCCIRTWSSASCQYRCLRPTARAMELAWQAGWADSVGSDRLAQRFDRLWEGPAGLKVPSLLLNATVVDGGNRIIASNIAIDGSFPDAFDAYHELIDLRRARAMGQGDRRRLF
ncbi:hypothetical protein HHL21_14080 [Massilia sp. RP-1-19]|uniref:Uncharacterized protein n=1 Tax=Massilia polaris TaxID=2728846 RepID=A0A848HLT9_9BURK|nr:hypothetical protein [Massilia polaris]NML62184.1 hypothetical protein [Massilia polaris]